MIKFNEIKMGDYLMGEYEGKQWWGEVINLNGDEKQVCLATEVQDFWFETADLYPVPLSDEAMLKLNFTKEEMPDGSVKYKKDSFRMLICTPGDFSQMDIWYRDDKRHNPQILYVHQLQNQYLQMTKVHLTDVL